jgi:glucokinase
MQALSLDMGGTHIGCGVVEDSKLLAHTSIPAEGAQSLAGLLPVLTETLQALLVEAGTTARHCSGLTIGFPGIVDVRNNAIHSTLKKYEDAPQLNLTGWSRDTFGLRLRVENDARMALLGERFAGVGRGAHNIVMMTLGTGIGTAVMIQDQMLRGVHSQAGCLGGHLPVNFHGRKCACGNIGCAESEASGWSMPIVAREFPGFAKSSLAALSHIGFRDLFTHANNGDAVAISVRKHCLAVWAANAVALIHAYDPEIVIMGGGVMHSADIIIPYVHRHVNEHAWSSLGKPQVRSATLGNLAAIMGAVPLLTEDVNAAKI